MARARFIPKEQGRFLTKAVKKSGLSIKELAKRYSLNERTLRDWIREKYFANYDVIFSISKDFDLLLPKIKKLDSYWYVLKGASIGAKKRNLIYGPPGTPEGRMFGGKVSQERRRNDPEKYRELGCNVRKNFLIPHYSEQLAELFGIIMGDGAINTYQVRITLNKNVDREYAYFVSSLVKTVLKETPTWSERDNVIMLTLSGVELVEILEKLGLIRGNKIINQIDFPKWIRKKRIYEIACVRGLFDTDGGLYFQNKGRKKYLGWCFASFSRPLLHGVEKILLNLRFNVKKSGEHKLYMYSLEQISRYIMLVGSNNPKNIAKLKLRIKG